MEKEFQANKEDLEELYKRSYQYVDYNFHFDKIETLKIDDKEYLIGSHSKIDNQFTDLGHCNPFTLAQNQFFVAEIKDGKLIGDNILIKSSSWDRRTYSEDYKRRMRHLDKEKLNSVQEGFTSIEAFYASLDKLPRVSMDSDRTVHNSSPDVHTMCDGFYNISNPQELINALYCKQQIPHISTPENLTNMKELLKKFVHPTDEEKQASLALEGARRFRHLRDFAKTHSKNTLFRKYKAKKFLEKREL